MAGVDLDLNVVPVDAVDGKLPASKNNQWSSARNLPLAIFQKVALLPVIMVLQQKAIQSFTTILAQPTVNSFRAALLNWI